MLENERGDRREARADKSPLPYVPDAETLTNANADGPDRSREPSALID
jgi:hypothetical protein